MTGTSNSECSRRNGLGLLLAMLGCAMAVVQVIFPGLLGIFGIVLIALLPTAGLFCVVLTTRSLPARPQPFLDAADHLSELNTRLTTQSREMASQSQELGQQRDVYKLLARKLVDKQAWLEAVIAQMPAGVLLIDRDLNVVTRNQRFQSMLGMPADAPPPRSLVDFQGWPAESLHGTPIPFEQWPLVKSIRDGVIVHDQEMRVGTLTGGWFEAAVSASPILDSHGQIRGGVLLMSDLTVRRANHERLRLLESAVVHANDAIIVLEAVSAEGKGRSVKYVNDGFVRLTGYEREEVMGRSLYFLRGVDSNAETLQTLKVALDTATPFRTELLNYRKDGSVLWVDLSLVPVQGPDGRCSHYIMIQRDITARKIAEAALRESEELFRGFFQTTSAGVYITDEEGRFISCNSSFAELVGRSVDDILKLTPKDITHPDDWLDQQALIDAVRLGQTDRYQFPKRYVRPDGKIVWTELTFAAIKDSDGNYQYGLGVSVDVSARRALEEQLRQSQKMEALGQLAGGIAHDFNNLLTAVLGNLAMLKLPQGDPNQERLRVVEQAAGRAADLTRKLLGYARRNQLLAAPTQPAALINEVVDILRHTFDPRIEIRSRVRTEAQINVDDTLINQALFNLCLNARDAMTNGGTLTIEADETIIQNDALPSADARPGHYVRFIVSDTGTGIDESIRDKLFEPFFTTKGVGKGTGLGLPMVDGIMRQHDGFVTVDSAPGRGAKFCLYFPIARTGSARRTTVNSRLTSDSNEHRALLESKESGPLPTSATVLLVDDEDMIRSLGRTVLLANGFKVLEAEDGQQAVDLFEKQPDQITLVVLDVTMPRLSGRDAFREMKRIDPNVRVLFSSGYSSEDVSEMDGSVGLLSKPYRPNDLLLAVRKALRDAPDLPAV